MAKEKSRNLPYGARCAPYYQKIRKDQLPPNPLLPAEFEPDPDIVEACKEQARKDLGTSYDLVEVGDESTIAGLLKQLEIEERIDGLMDKCLKRLLHVRGIKALASSPPSGSILRVTGPGKAA